MPRECAGMSLEVGILRPYQHFTDLPGEMRDQIVSEAAPADPEAWVHQAIPALGGRSFLEALDSPGGRSTVAEYLTRLQEMTDPGPHQRNLHLARSKRSTFKCSAARSEGMNPWIGPWRNPSRSVNLQRLTIDGERLAVSFSPAGIAVLSTLSVAFSVYLIATFGTVGLVVVAFFMPIMAGGFWFSRIAPYDLRTAQVKATEVFPLSTKIDGFEISTEAGGRTTLVWNIDVAGFSTMLADMGVSVGADPTG
jgi:Protein of unknown function (DUF2384)